MHRLILLNYSVSLVLKGLKSLHYYCIVEKNWVVVVAGGVKQGGCVKQRGKMMKAEKHNKK